MTTIDVEIILAYTDHTWNTKTVRVPVSDNWHSIADAAIAEGYARYTEPKLKYIGFFNIPGRGNEHVSWHHRQRYRVDMGSSVAIQDEHP